MPPFGCLILSSKFTRFASNSLCRLPFASTFKPTLSDSLTACPRRSLLLMPAAHLSSDNLKHPSKTDPITVNSPLTDTKIRIKLKPTQWSYRPNAFITPDRAYQEYLLTTNELKGLWSTTRRSPFDHKPEIIVFLRADVEKRAVQVWGNLAKIEQEKLRRRVEGIDENQHSSHGTLSSSKPSSSRRRLTVFDEFQLTDSDKAQRLLLKGSGRVVWLAISVDIANVFAKLFAYWYTGSSAIFAEAVHSIADTLNQLMLAFGIYQSNKIPDHLHPYGWYNVTYVSSLVSGVGIFFVGACLSWIHGIQALMHPEGLQSLQWALIVLAGSLVSESISLASGIRQIKHEAAEAKLSFMEFVRRGYDPSVNVILAEDIVAVSGAAVAFSCLTLSHVLGSHVPDAVGSLVIGTMLAGVASFIVYTNAIILVGRSIPRQRREMIRQELELDRMVRAVHDIKATEMGGRRVRFKAEVDIDGRELTRVYLDSIDMDLLLVEMQAASKSHKSLEQFMMKHGEAIVDLIGAEIDRVEKNIKKKFPEVRYVDLEVL